MGPRRDVEKDLMQMLRKQRKAAGDKFDGRSKASQGKCRVKLLTVTQFCKTISGLLFLSISLPSRYQATLLISPMSTFTKGRIFSITAINNGGQCLQLRVSSSGMLFVFKFQSIHDFLLYYSTWRRTRRLWLKVHALRIYDPEDKAEEVCVTAFALTRSAKLMQFSRYLMREGRRRGRCSAGGCLTYFFRLSMARARGLDNGVTLPEEGSSPASVAVQGSPCHTGHGDPERLFTLCITASLLSILIALGRKGPTSDLTAGRDRLAITTVGSPPIVFGYHLLMICQGVGRKISFIVPVSNADIGYNKYRCLRTALHSWQGEDVDIDALARQVRHASDSITILPGSRSWVLCCTVRKHKGVQYPLLSFLIASLGEMAEDSSFDASLKISGRNDSCAGAISSVVVCVFPESHLEADISDPGIVRENLNVCDEDTATSALDQRYGLAFTVSITEAVVLIV
ncbi:hypothetical protein EDD18DRAFT_1115610 [Armillaria luteobubalina]|uniref:Uncharacterized protein n=1 Tax=Armillaria luteobubalina TaxID=153913 RepID=A0AA39P2B9_9AGAR|nr:hypothetical protein EDD18DRAFT_1115610 [Armillaria luteobubalina]